MKNPRWILNWVQASEAVTDLYLYDYIAHKKSYNWLTGENGEEITAQDIVSGLAGVTTPEIVVHINSGGGDAAEGVAIAQAIKDERSKGRKIACQIDGICASAAVNVALACDPVRIPRNAYMMIHDPACNQDGLFTARELRKGADQLDVVKRGIVSGYAERTGLSDREIARMMAAETWMTGEEAVASHFADELLEAPVTIQRDVTTHNLLLNGCMVNSVAFEDMPEPLKAAQDTKSPKEETAMEIKNLEDLKTAYPDLCAQLENSARQEGQTEERERLQAIDDVAGVVSPELLNAAKYGEPTDAKDLLFKAAKAGELVNKAGAAVLAGMAKDAEPVNQVEGLANGGAVNTMTEAERKRAEAENMVTRALNRAGLNKKKEA